MQMRDQFVLQCIVQSPQAVYHDLKRNKLWIVGVGLAIILLILGSATLFFWLEAVAQDKAAPAGSEPFSWFTSLYFTVINFTTVGFGDITPKTMHGRWLSMANSVLGLLSFGWFVAVTTLALQPSQPSESAVLSALVSALTDGRYDREVEIDAPRKKARVHVIIEPVE